MSESKKMFYVWIEQINQSRIQVAATDKDSAIEKAKRVWHRDYCYPIVADCQSFEEYGE